MAGGYPIRPTLPHSEGHIVLGGQPLERRAPPLFCVSALVDCCCAHIRKSLMACPACSGVPRLMAPHSHSTSRCRYALFGPDVTRLIAPVLTFTTLFGVLFVWYVQVYPDKGTVAFGSGLHQWGFTLKKFAKIYAAKFGTQEEKMMQKLWGDWYFDAAGKKVRVLSWIVPCVEF